MDIMVVTDVERNDVEFISRTLGCQPVAHVDTFTADKLGGAALCSEVTMPGGAQRVVKITGVANPGKTCSILMRGTNKLTLDEADRSVHDALCVVRSLVKKRFMIAGGGVAESELSVKLAEWAKTQTGMKAYCVRAFAEVMGTARHSRCPLLLPEISPWPWRRPIPGSRGGAVHARRERRA